MEETEIKCRICGKKLETYDECKRGVCKNCESMIFGKTKTAKWLVIRFDFDENDMQFKRGGCMTFNSDKELLKFIKEVMVYAGRKYMWQITKTIEL